MDKYNFNLAEANIFKDELFLMPKEVSYDLTGSYTYPFLLIFGGEMPISDTLQIDFLNSILAQIPNQEKLTLANIGTINCVNPDSLLNLMRKFKPKYILTFACEEMIFGLPKDKFIPIILGEVGIIHASSIDALKNNKDERQQLWASMKIIFKIK